MNITCIFFGILFTVAGYLFAYGKGHLFLSAWKQLSQEDKKKIKIIPLCHNIGAVIALNGLIFLLTGCWSEFADHWFITAIIALLIVAGFDVWYINKSNRYLNQ